MDSPQSTLRGLHLRRSLCPSCFLHCGRSAAPPALLLEPQSRHPQWDAPFTCRNTTDNCTRVSRTYTRGPTSRARIDGILAAGSAERADLERGKLADAFTEERRAKERGELDQWDSRATEILRSRAAKGLSFSFCLCPRACVFVPHSFSLFTHVAPSDSVTLDLHPLQQS